MYVRWVRGAVVKNPSYPFIRPFPIGSVYGIFTYIYHQNQPNVVKYTIHGSYGLQGFNST